jgi:translation initiation factor 3 subunit G
MSKMRWGDSLDDDTVQEDILPPTTVVGPDAKGIKTVTEYRRNEKGETVKIVTKTRFTKVEKKLYKSVEERRKWTRFGDAVNEQGSDSVTVQSNDDIPFERARQQRSTRDEKQQLSLQAAMQQSDKNLVTENLKDLLYKRRMQRQLAAARGEIAGPERPPEEDGGPPGSGAGGALPAAGAKGGYVPPSLRNRAAGDVGDSMTRRREENSVRVTNLSEDTREEDLRELFSPFGPISRVYIAYDRETHENRGFAFVNFHYREDAQKAINKLDGYGYDNLILRVDWAQPREMK